MKQQNQKITPARVLLWTAVILWMTVIFAFSAQSAEGSSSLSGGTLETIFRAIIKDFDSLSPERQAELIGRNQLLIRKTAHFAAYMMLGILVMAALYQHKMKSRTRFLSALLISALYAASDEIHQLFVPGRSGMAADVALDACGAAAGILLVLLIYRIIQNKKHP